MSRSNRFALPAALLLSCGCLYAQAQTPAKPATKPPPAAAAAPAAGGKTMDGSAPSASSKVLSINELRECMKRQDDLKARGAELEQRRASLNQDRVKIDEETAAVVAQKEDVTKGNEAIKAFNLRLQAFSAQVASWTQRSEELKEATGMTAERRRKDLASERVALEKAEVSNKAEGDKLMSDLEETVKKVNARAEGQQQMSSSWNASNAKLNDDAQAYEDSRLEWRADCGNRRYREDDEKALRSGK